MKKPQSLTVNSYYSPAFRKRLKGFYLIISSLFISLLHLPFAFAKFNPSHRSLRTITVAPATDTLLAMAPAKSVYDSLHLNMAGLSKQAFDYAKKGWAKLIAQGKVLNESVIAIVDFSQPSTQKRLYVLDMKNYKVLFNTLVAHGRNSGKEWAASFSNRASSFKSSPGFYVTGDTYIGENGYSLKLNGMERGINDLAFKRAIVMHGADYVNESYAEGQGYIGRSLGCPAVPREEAREIIDAIKDGTCLFVYAPNGYATRSGLLN